MPDKAEHLTSDHRGKRIRKMPLFTRGKQPAIDRLKMCCDLFGEMEPNEREATFQYIASKFDLWRRARW